MTPSPAVVGSLWAFPAVLAGGVLSGLNPCCLPLYPAAAASCCATRSTEVRRSLGRSLAFAAGLVATTTALGVAAAFFGRAVAGLGGGVAIAIGLIPIVMGVHLLGWLTLPLPSAEKLPRSGGLVGSFLAGLLLSLVMTPCSTPLLASVLSLAAWGGEPIRGGLLLLVYGLGEAIPILLLGSVAIAFAAWLERRGARIWIDRVAGAALVGTGLWILWSA